MAAEAARLSAECGDVLFGLGGRSELVDGSFRIRQGYESLDERSADEKFLPLIVFLSWALTSPESVPSKADPRREWSAIRHAGRQTLLRLTSRRTNKEAVSVCLSASLVYSDLRRNDLIEGVII